jgi:hypothetical protein
VWPKLFEPSMYASHDRRHPTSSAMVSVVNRMNPLLLAPSRGLYFNAPFFLEHRRTYQRVFQDTFKLRRKLRNAMKPFEEKFANAREAGGRVFGLHCRMATAAVSNAQSTGLAMPCASEEVLSTLTELIGPDDILFLASDSSSDVDAVSQLLGDQCVYQVIARRSPAAPLLSA